MLILARFSDPPRAETTAVLGLTGCKGEPLLPSGLRYLDAETVLDLLLFTCEFQSKVNKPQRLGGLEPCLENWLLLFDLQSRCLCRLVAYGS
jgi:hypothetical protein